VKVNAVLWFRANDAVTVIITVQQWSSAVVQAAETALRDAIGQSDLDQLLKERNQVNARLLELLGRTVSRWGVAVDSVEIKNLDIPEEMQRAIAREAEAIREKRARIIKAEGEHEAARTLAEAAAMLGGGSAGLELRRLQTLSEIGAEHNSTIVTVIPSEFLRAAQALAAQPGKD
jgi:regulator of protease activity HflC (stomatin/prohibitin superfamily)